MISGSEHRVASSVVEELLKRAWMMDGLTMGRSYDGSIAPWLGRGYDGQQNATGRSIARSLLTCSISPMVRITVFPICMRSRSGTGSSKMRKSRPKSTMTQLRAFADSEGRVAKQFVCGTVT